MGSTVQRANASTRGITSEIGPIDEDIFHRIKQKLGGSPDVSHRILKNGLIDPIGKSIFAFAAAHPSFERVFNSPKSEAAYDTWKMTHAAEYKKALAEAKANAEAEEKQKAKGREKRGAKEKKEKGGGPSKLERRALKAARQRQAAQPQPSEKLRAEGFTEYAGTAPDGTPLFKPPDGVEFPFDTI